MNDSKIFVGLRPIRSSRDKPTQPSGPKCQWDSCENSGTQRAPVGSAAEGLYLTFWLEHSKAYGRGYSYYPSHSDPVVAKYQLNAAAGKIATRGVRTDQPKFEAPLPSSVPSGSAKSLKARGKASQPSVTTSCRTLKPLEAKAFETLGLQQVATPEDIRRRYKERLKLHHPDVNSGNRQSEDRLHATIEAYKILKLNGFC
ncbi:J domain-containing protein [Rhizobium sp. 2MFCol3.1]|uniref:J domain-containing protein n=1 Tax=Rhizobium sp. 2MFCol3.1 TaxID=1246459 RepID=UPI00036CE6C1|nr:J domain-containing protein [Rhizobium sp. 2MFCol3.1]